MPEHALFRALEWPPVYRFAQAVLAPGAHSLLTRELRSVADRLHSGGPILDVGCGPTTWLSGIGLHPIGLDLSFEYSSSLLAGGSPAVTGSATDLPFADEALNCVWSIGLLHHLPDDAARTAIREMMRVTRPGGSITIFDGILPRLTARPFIWAMRRLDRGRFMRTQSHLESLLDPGLSWSCRRVNYSLIGHEGVFCVAHTRG